MTNEPLPCGAGSGGQLVFRHASLLQALPEFGLPPALFPVSLLALSELPFEGAALLAIRGRDEIGYPHVDADHRRVRFGLNSHRFIVGERQPPDLIALLERHAAVDLATFACFRVRELLFVVGRKPDREQERVAFVQR